MSGVIHAVTIVYLPEQSGFGENGTSQMGLAFVNRSFGKASSGRRVQCVGILHHILQTRLFFYLETAELRHTGCQLAD